MKRFGLTLFALLTSAAVSLAASYPYVVNKDGRATNITIVSGTISGNGAGLTNLNGANIVAGTVNSNVLDTATRSMLGASGILTLNGTGTNTTFVSTLTLTGPLSNAVFRVVTTSNITDLTYNTNQIVISAAVGDQNMVGVYNYAWPTNYAGDYQVWTNAYYMIGLLASEEGVQYDLYAAGYFGWNQKRYGGASQSLPSFNWVKDDNYNQNDYPTAGYLPTNTITFAYSSTVQASNAPMQSDTVAAQATNLAANVLGILSGQEHHRQLAWQAMLYFAGLNKFQFLAGPLVGRSAYGAGAAYENICYGDYGYNMPGLQWLVNPDDLYQIMATLCSNQKQDGRLPNTIDANSVAGTFDLGPLDFLTLANEVYYHWRQTGKTTAFDNFKTNLDLVESVGHVTNNILWFSNDITATYYGADQDMGFNSAPADFAGYEALGSLGYYDAWQKLAAVAAAAGDIHRATNYLHACSNAVESIETTLWDSSSRLLKAYSTTNWTDAMASAYAVYLGAVRPAIKAQIVSRFADDWGTWSLYNADGATLRGTGGNKLYAWAPYTHNLIRQWDNRKADQMMDKLLSLYASGSSPEPTSTEYMMGPALLYAYLTEPPEISVPVVGVTSNVVISGVTLLITNGVVKGVE